MKKMELVALFGMIVSTLLLWFIKHVNNKTCEIKLKIIEIEAKLHHIKITELDKSEDKSEDKPNTIKKTKDKLVKLQIIDL